MQHSRLSISFRSQLIGVCLKEWNRFHTDLQFISPCPHVKDKLVWRWSCSGIFSVHSSYLWLEFEEILNTECEIIGQINMSLKIKAFL